MATMTVERVSRAAIEITNIHDIADLLMAEASLQDMTYLAIAEEAGCCNTTVSKFLNKETRSPHFRTVQGIAKALGYRLLIKKG